jgi:ubiquinone/menaquinone biosynthesis C-methylase UbiE
VRATDTIFAGAVPELYDRFLVPLIFQPYADDLARRLPSLAPARVLELACGTGIVTRAIAATLAADVEIVATDLNPAMLAQAQSTRIARAVQWRQADAMKLPFDDASFAAIVCQFGAMFFPDKPAAFAEARRVLEPGGTFLFNVWDRIEDNELADVVVDAVARLFPADPPRFLARTPHGYHDVDTIKRDVVAAGFASPAIETVALRSRASTALEPAIAYCQGTVMRDEIVRLDPTALERATKAAAAAIEQRFGPGPIDSKIQAHVVIAKR